MARYKATLQKVRHYKDKLGMGMDPHIIKTVALLNVMGFKTSMSCEGHMTRNYADIVPWVHVDINHNRKKSYKCENWSRRIRSIANRRI